MKYSYYKSKLYLLLFVLILFLLYIEPVLAQGEIKVSVENLNVRSGPGLEYSIVSNISNQQTYNVIDEHDNWYKIQISGIEEAWVASWLVEYQTIESNKEEERFTEDDRTDTDKKQPLSRSPIRAPSLVIDQQLTHRSTHELTYKSLGLIAQGAPIEIVRAQQGWFGLPYQGLKGWITTKLIERSELLAIFRTILQSNALMTNMEEEEVDEPFATVTINSDGTNLRGGAGIDYEIVGRANAGETFPVLNQVGDWYEINLPNDTTAFVAAWIVNASSSQENKTNTNPNLPLSGKRIVIDPGHGGNDSGAIGPHFGSIEKTLNIEVSNLLKSRLEEAGAKVYMTRTDDRFISLQQRIDISIIHGADAFLSIHHNTNDDSSLHGTITYFYSNVDRELANILQEDIVKSNGLKDLNARRGDFFVLRENPRPSVLIELGFLTNYNDELKLRSLQTQQSSVEGIYHGLVRYFNR